MTRYCALLEHGAHFHSLILPKLTYSGFSLRALQGIISSLKEVILGGDKDSAK